MGGGVETTDGIRRAIEGVKSMAMKEIGQEEGGETLARRDRE